MTRLLRALFRPIWKLAAPVRRKTRNQIEEMIQGCVDNSLARSGLTHQVGPTLDELLVVLDSLVTEVYRLQARVEELSRPSAAEQEPGEWRRVG